MIESTYTATDRSRARATRSASTLNSLEPPSLPEAFYQNPPEGFRALKIATSNGDTAPAFFADFDILTTLDDEHRWIINLLAKVKASGLTTMPTLFAGTTVTEYTGYPHLNEKGCSEYVEKLVAEALDRKASLLIIKDLPQNSPLLSKEENLIADRIMDICAADKRFLVVEGQALAYVPIDFATIDEYLARCGKKTRKDLRRKIRSRANLQVEAAPTGRIFHDQSLLNQMYEQYLNVYDQSQYHFDKLSRRFFEEILTNGKNGGIVFIYKDNDGDIIGYNICFEHNNMLVDKYVGFEYPAAREANLYFVSWFHNLEYCLERGLSHYIAGWTDPAVKAYLGASFTSTRHAVFIRNSLLRAILQPFRKCFENDSSFGKSGGKS